MTGECSKSVTHAARAAAKQLNKVSFQAPLVAVTLTRALRARRARPPEHRGA